MRLVTKAVGIMAGATLAASAYATHRLTRKGTKTDLDAAFFYTPFELGIPFENVAFHNSQSLRLNGWWLDRPATRKVVVLCPGYGRNKSDLLGIGSHLWKAGYNVLMFDFRDQGESEPAVATIGHFERLDLEAALDYIHSRIQNAEIGAVGYSMGAAVAIMTAATRPDIRVLVADSSFADLSQILRIIFKQVIRLPATPLFEITELLVRLRARYHISSVRPVDYIGKIAPRPIMIIHGDRDGIAPIADAHALYAAAGDPKKLWITSDTGHCGTYFLDRQIYIDKVVGFFMEWLGVPENDTIYRGGAMSLGRVAAK